MQAPEDTETIVQKNENNEETETIVQKNENNEETEIIVQKNENNEETETIVQKNENNEETSCSNIAEPIVNLSSLLDWEPEDMSTILEVALASVPPLNPSTAADIKTPKTLVCHDMQGGYLDDRYLFGCRNKAAYRMVHWSGVDTFIYFSHHFITIPPPGWTASAHNNGVPILGTFITESTEGKAICEELFSSLQMVESVVEKLVQIAQLHKLQGWLINIENEVDSVAAGLVVVFLLQLTRAMKAIDDRSCVIWYDSITSEGKLQWQDELNDRNSCFYAACDAIFLNYTWKIPQLAASRDYARACRNMYGTDRKCDETKVYVGVDVFGRNCYEGGGFNSYRAMQVIRDHGLSAAIFAPGWTYEVLGCQDFVTNDTKFWALLQPVLRQHGMVDWPLHTTFNEGCGGALYSRGQETEEGDWYNLCDQSLMPDIAGNSSSSCRISLCSSDAYDGGSCLLVANSAQEVLRVSLWRNCSLTCLTGGVRARVAFKASVQETDSASEAAVKGCSASVGDDGSLLISFSTEAVAQDGAAVQREEQSNGWILCTLDVTNVGAECVISTIAISVPAGVSLQLGLLTIDQATAE